jgi:hypothetical protein
MCRLAKICGLFSSDKLGERAAAAWQADRLVRAAGLTWCDLLAPTLPAPDRVHDPRVCMTAAEILKHHSHDLTDWERQFLKSLARRKGTWTWKQHRRFDEIHARVVECDR